MKRVSGGPSGRPDRPSRAGRSVPYGVALAVLLAAPLPALAGPFIWDDDQNRIDDRIETVHLLGYALSFENGDPELRQRFDVTTGPGGLVYGVFVVYEQPPTATDVMQLQAIGMPILHTFQNAPAIRSAATFVQVQLAAGLPNVERVEAVPVLYPLGEPDAASIGVRDATGRIFPTWATAGGGGGEGVVVAILDTGINDAPVDAYPGHQALIGRCVGGASFVDPGGALNTPLEGSVNPYDGSGTHGTHVAGIVLGSGTPEGYAMGVAPAARFVDVKVLGSAGTGTLLPEALDWCIHNRDRDWTGEPAHAGIDVINLSLSSLDASDGNDLASRLARQAAELGVIVVASTGNEGLAAYCPSPAAGDGVIAVGAWDTQRTSDPGDDGFPEFSDYGPRAGDGDADAHDEQKPDLVAPGVAVLSADGNLLSDGAQYVRLSGTSMSAAMVTGAAALLLGDAPALTPGDIADLLRRTARRDVSGLPGGAPGPDPRWSAPIGFGILDLYAARLELLEDGASQVRRLVVRPDATELDVEVWTQRERGAAHFVLESRCASGGPCTFAPVDSAAAIGDSSLANPVNLQRYAFSIPVKSIEYGTQRDFRVSFTENGVRHDGPWTRVTLPAGPPMARIEWTIVHNAFDTDIDAALEIGGTELAPLVSIPLGGTSSAVASEWVDGIAALGNVAWTFHVPIEAGAAPAPGQAPWRLRISEGGFLNRAGRVTEFRVVDLGPGGTTHIGGPTPRQTLEGQTWWIASPQATTATDRADADPGLRYGPNPVRGGQRVSFATANDPQGPLEIYDLAGRRLAATPFMREGELWRAEWRAVGAAGRTLPAGLYFARIGTLPARRIAVIDR